MQEPLMDTQLPKVYLKTNLKVVRTIVWIPGNIFDGGCTCCTRCVAPVKHIYLGKFITAILPVYQSFVTDRNLENCRVHLGILALLPLISYRWGYGQLSHLFIKWYPTRLTAKSYINWWNYIKSITDHL